MFEVPVLVPEQLATYEFQSQREALIGRSFDELGRRRRARSGVRVQSWLALPVSYLAPGQVLDAVDVDDPAAGRFVFSPPQLEGKVQRFTAAQKDQMVTVYRSVPHGCKGVWLDRHGTYAGTLAKWGRAKDQRERAGWDADQAAAADAAGVGVPVRALVLSDDYIRDLVHHYHRLPRGQKRAFLDDHGIDANTMHSWKVKVVDGTLSSRRRQKKGQSSVDADRVEQLEHELKEAARLNRKMAAKLNEADRTIAQQKKDLKKAARAAQAQQVKLQRAEATCDVLGKALETMPDIPGVDYDAEDNPYPKSTDAAMRLVDKKNNNSSRP